MARLERGGNISVAKRQPVVPEPGRIRRIEGTFGWLDHRLLREKHLERMTLQDIGVYVFLILAANRDGVSWWRKDVISNTLGIGWDEFETAKARLIERGFVAFRPFHHGDINGFYQVLPIPGGPHA